MSRNSVGRDYSFILFGTVASESCKANSNYLLTHRCEPETKEAHLPLPLLAQESRFIPGSRRCKLESKPVSFADFLSCPCFQSAHNNTALHASPIHYTWKTNVYMYCTCGCKWLGQDSWNKHTIIDVHNNLIRCHISKVNERSSQQAMLTLQELQKICWLKKILVRHYTNLGRAERKIKMYRTPPKFTSSSVRDSEKQKNRLRSDQTINQIVFLHRTLFIRELLNKLKCIFNLNN